MNLLIVNGYDKNGWGKLARYGLQPICEFYRDQLKIINSKIKTTFIYPSMNLDENYDESFIKSFTGIVWTCLLYTSPSPRDRVRSRMPSSA